VADSLLGCSIERTAYIDAHDQGLRRSEATATVKELAKGSPGKSLAHHKDIPFAFERDLAVVKDRFDARVAKA
jgi:hypothetical protein